MINSIKGFLQVEVDPCHIIILLRLGYDRYNQGLPSKLVTSSDFTKTELEIVKYVII